MIAPAVQQDFAPEVATWKKLQGFVREHGIGRFFRGSFGLAMLPLTGQPVRQGHREFWTNADLAFVTLQDLPAGALYNDRAARIGSVIVACTRFGLPNLGHELVCQYDTSRPPVASKLQEFPFLLKILNALDISMTSAAFARGLLWQEHRKGWSRLGFDAIAPPPGQTWVPIPYLAFRMQDASQVLKWATTATRHSFIQQDNLLVKVDSTYYWEGILRWFLGELRQGLHVTAPQDTVMREGLRKSRGKVYLHLEGLQPLELGNEALLELAIQRNVPIPAGSIVAYDYPRMPDWWLTMGDREAWIAMPRILSEARFTPIFDRWFWRHAVVHADKIWWPAPLVAMAAKEHALPGELLWEVTPETANHWRTDVGAYVFPPVRIDTWDQFHGVLPKLGAGALVSGTVTWDLVPQDRRPQELVE